MHVSGGDYNTFSPYCCVFSAIAHDILPLHLSAPSLHLSAHAPCPARNNTLCSFCLGRTSHRLHRFSRMLLAWEEAPTEYTDLTEPTAWEETPTDCTDFHGCCLLGKRLPQNTRISQNLLLRRNSHRLHGIHRTFCLGKTSHRIHGIHRTFCLGRASHRLHRFSRMLTSGGALVSARLCRLPEQEVHPLKDTLTSVRSVDSVGGLRSLTICADL